MVLFWMVVIGAPTRSALNAMTYGIGLSIALIGVTGMMFHQWA
jgi:hypothetical protein